MKRIRMVLFDIDGVITDGKKYINGIDREWKSVSLKDLDTFQLFKDKGCKIGCISGEDTEFSRKFANMQILDFIRLGCKEKDKVLEEIIQKHHIECSDICYVGDGKYDISILQKVGLAVCPNDAIDKVKKVSDIVLSRKGGEGCIAEIYELLFERSNENIILHDINSALSNRMIEHRNILNATMEDTTYISNIGTAINIIKESYKNGKCLFLCGNGGSAADAQHLAAEMVGRFYHEREALKAEALTVNTSIITSLANDYNYDKIFARQLEAKAVKGDVLIGISTSGTSANILQALKKAKEINLNTILMTGRISEFESILEYTDCLLAVPSCDTPRIQEIHILTGHIICEIVEQEFISKNKRGNNNE